MKNDPIETALASLDTAPLHTPEGRPQFEKALVSRFGLVAAKAARLAAEAQWLDLAPALTAAFFRILQAGNGADKGCAAKVAIARALVRFEHDDAALFLRGMKHVQMEPVWGGQEDRAAELRAVCAIGLVNSTGVMKLNALVDLLADPEWVARAGAARALGAMGGEAAAILLKFKCLSGDGPEVLADCYQGLIAADPALGVPFVAGIAETATNEDEREAAILSLGASRRGEAIEKLIEIFSHSASPPVRKCILLSLATSRTQSAIDFLLNLIRSASPSACALAVTALAVFRNDQRFRGDIQAAIESRTDGAGAEAFRAAFAA